MNIGKLYQLKQYYWFLFPSKEIAARNGQVTLPADLATAYALPLAFAAQLSERSKSNVTFVTPNNIFILLEEDGKFLKVLAPNGEMGWMKNPENEEWTKGCIEEVKE